MRKLTMVALVTAVLALTGCGIVPGIGPDPRADAQPVAEVTCPETYADGYAEAGLVPADFVAVAVLRCDPYAWNEDAPGGQSGALFQRLEGDLEPVLAALAQPSDPLSVGACPAIAYLEPELWIEEADGTVVRAAIPSTGCGMPKDVGLDAAIDALAVVTERFIAD